MSEVPLYARNIFVVRYVIRTNNSDGDSSNYDNKLP